MLKRLIRQPLKFSSGLYTIALCLTLVGCQKPPVKPYVKEATSQYLVVNTQRVSAARCEISDQDNGVWSVAETPETIDVTNAKGTLSVSCYKSGYKPTMVETNADAEEVTVWMEPTTWSSKQQKEVWQKAKAEYEKNR